MNCQTLFKLIVVPVFFLSSLSLAQSPDELERIRHQIDEAQVAVENMVANLKPKADGIDVTFPDYSNAFAVYSNEAQQAAEDFKSELQSIMNDVDSRLSQEYAGLKALQELHEQMKTRSTKSSLLEAKRRIGVVKKQLVNELESQYQEALYELLSLNGRLIFPTKRLWGEEWASGWLNDAGGPLGGLSFATALGLTLPGYYVSASVLSPLVIVVPIIVGDRFYRNNFGGVYDPIDDDDYDEFVSSVAREIYKECSTAGCVSVMSVHYVDWFKNAVKLNKTLKLAEDLTLKKLKVVGKSKYSRKVFKQAQMLSDDLPIGVVTPVSVTEVPAIEVGSEQ